MAFIVAVASLMSFSYADQNAPGTTGMLEAPIGGKQTLVLADSPQIRDTHSIFFDALQVSPCILYIHLCCGALARFVKVSIAENIFPAHPVPSVSANDAPSRLQLQSLERVGFKIFPPSRRAAILSSMSPSHMSVLDHGPNTLCNRSRETKASLVDRHRTLGMRL